jgi:hypothetical protein
VSTNRAIRAAEIEPGGLVVVGSNPAAPTNSQARNGHPFDERAFDAADVLPHSYPNRARLRARIGQNRERRGRSSVPFDRRS